MELVGETSISMYLEFVREKETDRERVRERQRGERDAWMRISTRGRNSTDKMVRVGHHDHHRVDIVCVPWLTQCGPQPCTGLYLGNTKGQRRASKTGFCTRWRLPGQEMWYNLCWHLADCSGGLSVVPLSSKALLP